MIICEEKKFIFIRNPKTASRSTSEFLLNNFECFEFDEYHAINIPKKYEKFTIYLTIRSPFSRAVSAWKHVVSDGEKGLNKHDKLKFEQYLEKKRFCTKKDGFNFFYQSDLVNQFDKNLIKIIYFEKIETQIQGYFNKSNLGFKGYSGGLDWKECYKNKNTEKMALNILEKDINMFRHYKKVF
jgi:hypothetical protein